MIYNRIRHRDPDEINLCQLYNNKKCADKIWEKVLEQTYEKAKETNSKVKRDQGELANAIAHCNTADKAILDFIFRDK